MWTVDLLLTGWLGTTVGLVLLFWGRIPAAGWVAGGHLLALAAYLVLKLAASRNRALQAAYLLSPLLLVFAVFQALGLIIPHLREGTADAALAALDVRLFGSDPTRWIEGRLGAGWAAVLQFCYTTYYFLFVILAIALLRTGRIRTFVSNSAAIVGCFLTTYVGYYLVPAYGPRTHFRYDEPLPLAGVPAGIHELLDDLEYIKLDAFPSGHTALSVLSLILLFRLKVRLAWLLAPLVLGLIVSTVVLRYHYAIDVLAGLLCAALWYPWGLRLVRRIDTPGRHHDADVASS